MFDYERDIYHNMVHRCQIKEVLNGDGDNLQQCRATGYASEEMETIRAQTHGFSSSPPVGSLGYAINLQGRKDLAILIGGEMPGKRVNNKKPGESALYDDQGQKVHVQRTGIRVNAAQGAHSVVVDADSQHRVQAGGYNIFTVKSLANFRVLQTSDMTWHVPQFVSSSAPPADPTRA
jgi:phage gp45-like